MKIAIGSDHAGFKIKQVIVDYLKNKDLNFFDFGTYSEDSSDYPDFAHPVAKAVLSDQYDIGIVVCGSGNGINMVVNKYAGIRSALCWKSEIAYLSRLHNDANICSIPGRYVTGEEAIEIVNQFLNTDFEGGRHLTRINKIDI